MTEPRRSWFDGTINLPTIFSVIAAATTASVFGVTVYNGLEHRVTVLEQKAIQVESDKTDVRQALSDINGKLDKLNDRLIANSAGQQPGISRWAK